MPAETTLANGHIPDTAGPLAKQPGDVGRLIRQTDLFRRMAVSDATGYRLASAGKIGPQPIRVGGGVKYHLAEVVAWLAHRRPDGTLYDRQSWPAAWVRVLHSVEAGMADQGDWEARHRAQHRKG
jgi:predicted DNA-binding transcriptional regulator AlpA